MSETTPAQPIAASAAEAALSAGAQTEGELASGFVPAASAAGAAATPQADAGPATVEVSGALIGRLAMNGSGGGPGEPPGGAAAPAAAVTTRLTAAQRAGELSCELSGMDRSATDNCTAPWLSNQSFLAASPESFPSGASPRTGPPSGGYGAPAGGSHPVIPPPGPAPSGAVGGSATGATGIAMSGFFTLAGLLLLAAPRAMRRLRLSCQPWLTAFFVLIPERPG